jgi:hypothetical protein
MFVTRTRAARAAVLATIAGATLTLGAATRIPASSYFGGPWISIETPVNPYEASTNGALLLVHTFHHGIPVTLPLAAKAEGLVDGQRRSVAQTPTKSAQAGTYAVRNEWGNKGLWTLLLTATQGEPRGSIQAVVEIGADGQVSRVSVPRSGQGTRLLTDAEVDRGLRERAKAPMVVGGR